MSTILILNGVSSTVAALCLGGAYLRARRQARREAEASVAYRRLGPVVARRHG